MRCSVRETRAFAASNRFEQMLVFFVFVWLAFRTFRVIQAGWSFTTDDAYITLRYARHLAEGNGIVWNVGDAAPVEGYSNFFFVCIGSSAIRLGLDPMTVVKSVSCATLVPTCGVLYLLARVWLRPLAATLPAILLLSHPGMVFWAVSGLETSVFQLFVVSATTAFVVGIDGTARVRRRLHVVAAGFCFLAALTRPEGPIVAAVLLGTAVAYASVDWARAKQSRDDCAQKEALRGLVETTFAFTITFLLPYASYFGWRVVHFGRLLPNTVYCKRALSETGDPWTLVRDFWNEGKVFVVLAAFQDPRKLGARSLPLLLLAPVYAAVLYGADPIVGQHSRHFLAALALLVVASSIGLTNLAAIATLPVRLATRVVGSRVSSTNEGSRTSIAGMILDASLVLGCLAIHHRGQLWLADDTPRACAHDDADREDKWQFAPPVDLAYHASCYSRRMEARAALGHYLDESLTKDQAFLIGDSGIVPYLSHAKVIDAFCLNSRELTSAPISFDRGRFLDWIFARLPDRLIVHSSSPTRLQPRGEYGFYPALVADPRFGSLYREAHRPIGAPRDGFAYWIYERKPPACTLALSTAASACDACLRESCCSESNACARRAECALCMSAENPSVACQVDSDYVRLTRCVATSCSSPCSGE